MAVKGNISGEIERLMEQIKNCKVTTQGQGRAMRQACNKNNKGLMKRIKALQKAEVKKTQSKNKDARAERLGKLAKNVRTKTQVGEGKGNRGDTKIEIDNSKKIKTTDLSNRQKQEQGMDVGITNKATSTGGSSKNKPTSKKKPTSTNKPKKPKKVSEYSKGATITNPKKKKKTYGSVIGDAARDAYDAMYRSSNPLGPSPEPKYEGYGKEESKGMKGFN